jgi:MFS family permease
LTLQFFAMFGFFFVILQFAQLVLGYSPLQAASAMIPMALMLIAGARGVAPRLAARVGIRIPMVTGLLLMAAGLMVLSTLGPGSGYPHLLAGLLMLGAGAGLSTAPATTAIVAALPAEKQGVASAVNDTAREVGGALGIAVLGSVLADAYASGVEVAVEGIPAVAGEAATNSLAAALTVSEQLGRPELAQAAQAAFADGLGAAFLLGAGALVVAATWVFVRLPRGLVNGSPHHADEPATTAGAEARPQGLITRPTGVR